MANAIRAVTIERGRDPRDFTLVAYGGAGPLHAAALAEELQITRVLIPAGSGTFAAFGMQVTDLRHDVARTFVTQLDAVDATVVETAYQDLEASARRFMESHGAVPVEPTIGLTRRIDARYVGQFHPLSLELPAGSFAEVAAVVPELFHAAHEQRYGHAARDEAIEISALRVTATRAVRKAEPSVGPLAAEQERASRDVYFEDGTKCSTPVYDSAALPVGHRVEGPAIIEEDTTHIVVPPRCQATVLPKRHILIEIGTGAWT
jgi:N-methylhydantoinase A